LSPLSPLSPAKKRIRERENVFSDFAFLGDPARLHLTSKKNHSPLVRIPFFCGDSGDSSDIVDFKAFPLVTPAPLPEALVTTK
jgi:hypothetical protein